MPDGKLAGATGRVYLNNAASSWPKAPGVVEAVTQALQEPPAHPGRVASQVADAATECRVRLASLLDVHEPDQIVLTTGATQALNLAILGVDLPRGAHVVTTVTEHNSVLRPLHHMKQRLGLRITTVGLDADGALDVQAFNRAMRDDPTLVVINHASNVTGCVNNVAPLFARAHDTGAVTLLDAAQSLGHIPVHPESLGADLVAMTGHKGLFGPPGTGALYVAPHLDLTQVLVGGTGVRSDLALHPPQMPMRLEAGTPGTPAFAGLAAALRYIEENGDSLRAQSHRLTTKLRDGLSSLPSVTLFGTASEASPTGVVSFAMADWSVADAGSVLEESFGIICRTGLHCAPLIHEAIGSAPEGTIRLSVSGRNREADVEAALCAVKQIYPCALSI